ncbi:MAG: DNA polymerase III subunit delta [Bacteroidota bacterium]
MLISNARDGRVSHAQLFLGEDGSGNLPLALAYATYLFCLDKQELDSCGQCANCVKAGKLAHPDLHFTFPFIASSGKVTSCKDVLPTWRTAITDNPYIDYNGWLEALGAESKQGLINKEEGLEIIHRVTLKAYEGGYKISIIWKPETLNSSSANALLKIIEEPPANTIFLFVANKADEILPTILSRTQLVKVNRLPVDVLAHALEQRFQLPADKAHSLAAVSEGNFMEACHQLQKSDSELMTFENFRNWMRMCYKPDVSGLTDWAEDTAKLGREKIKQFIQYALFIARQCMLKHYLGDEKLAVRGAELDFVSRFSPFINERNIIEMNDQFDEAYRDIARNGNPKIVLLDLSFKTIVLLKK